MSVEFKAWPKIGRNILGDCVITEKYDGTNACVIIEEGEIVGVQSRKRLITPEDDNYGFAKYVHENKEIFLKLGDGRHFGEWVGLGIQKNPHGFPEKRDSICLTLDAGVNIINHQKDCMLLTCYTTGLTQRKWLMM